jgi:predicted DNA-binding transcriptional regulator YafY
MAGHGRNESIRRLLALLRRVDGMRYAPSLHDLAREFGVSHRTIRRDLDLLEEVGFKVPKWRQNEEAA